MKRGLVVSDLHCGSIYGLLPPSFTNFANIPVPQNAGQEYTWECWLDMRDRAARFHPDFVIVNGDVVDGPQRKSEGAELSLPSPDDQQRAAVDTLLELKRYVPPSCKWYFTQGTPYHVGNWGSIEESVARTIGATPYYSVGTGELCRESLYLQSEGVILEAAHHIGVSTGFYRLTALDREMQWSALAAKDASKGMPKVDLVIRSHVHYFSRGEHASKEGVTTPCWQLQTRYMRKASTTRMLPDIGAIFVEMDGEAKLRGEEPCRVIKKLYPLPPMPITEL